MSLSIPLTVANPTTTPRFSWPITSGVPLPPGVLSRGNALCLTDASGARPPLQWEPLAFWPDGSVKWALLDFQADVPAGSEAKFHLEKASGPAPEPRVKLSRRGDAVRIGTGALRVSLDCAQPGLIDGLWLRRADGAEEQVASRLEAHVRTAAGEFIASRSHMDVEVERRGPLRATVVLQGEHLNRAGRRCFSFVFRLHAFAGLPLLKLEYLFLNDNSTGVFTKVREVKLELRCPVGRASSPTLESGKDARPTVTIAGFPDGPLKRPVRLFQKDDTQCILEGLGRRQKGEQAPGWCAVRRPLPSEPASVTAVVRDFWQQWPKSLEVDENRLSLGLLPALGPGEYDGCEPVDMYYYLFRGRDYLIKTGVAKRHEVWLSLSSDSPEDLAAAVNQPLMAVADPQWMAETGAWGEITAAAVSGQRSAVSDQRTEDDKQIAEYDRLSVRNAEAYEETVVNERYYGVLNWGDWFGERKYNWGNGEYDPAHAFLLLFARTGDVKHFWWGERAARHQADVDILHALNDDYLNSGEIRGYDFPLDVGAMYLHAFGHVGGYLPLKKAARLYPGAYTAADPRNLGHLWNEGLLEAYYLTGDPWLKEAALKLADYLVGLAKIEDFTWWFGRDPHCGRTAGWPLHALMAAYRATNRQKYLRAAKRIVELALADQDPNCGGWLYRLYPGHCHCERQHVGMAVFITCVLLAGMIEYHYETQDSRVAESIVRAVDFIIHDAWDDIEAKFHYTSCPATALRSPDRDLWPLAYACRLAREPRHLHVLKKAWQTYLSHLDQLSGGSAFGKSFAMLHRSEAHVLALMEELGA